MLKRFRTCRSGSIVVIFALVLIPTFAAIGLAVDYSYAVAQRTRLQTAIDATALSLAHVQRDLSDIQLKTRATEVFAMNFKSDPTTTLGAINVSRGTDSLTVNASANVKTQFARVVNKDSLDISSKGKVVWGPVRVEVALALDNTYSMDSGGKMGQLKLAAKALVDTLEGVAEKPGDVKIGMAPFGSFARLDPALYKDAAWVRFRGEAYSEEYDCKYSNGRKYGCKYRMKYATFNKIGWKGCISDRDQDYDTNDAYSAANENTKYPAVENGKCIGTITSGASMDQTRLATVRTLGWDFNAIRTAIAGMTPVGTTNVTIGFQLGLALLSHTAPFTEGVNPANASTEGRTEKVLILLTDGENTESRYKTPGSYNNATDINPRTKLACAEVKKLATVYTIRLGNEGDAGMLLQCASDAGKYYDVDDVNKLKPVFQKIADEISKLRVAS